MNTARWSGGVAAAVVLLSSALGHADGVVDRHRVDPHGRVSGVILQDGTELVAPPAQAATLRSVVRPSDLIRTPTGPQNTLEIENARTGQALDVGSIDSAARGGGPASVAVPYAREDDVRALGSFRVDGRVAMLTHTPNGAVSGLVMTDGTQAHLVRNIDGVLDGVHPGDRLRVAGRGTQSAQGRGLWAMTISRPDGLVLLDMTRGIGAPELNLGRQAGP